LPLRHRHGYAVDLHHGLPAQAFDTRPGVPRDHPPSGRGCAPHTSPHPPGWSWRPMKRRNSTGSSRTPSRLAHRARPVRQSRADATLSRLLPPSPATPGSGCLQLHPTATTARRRRSLTPIRNNSASWRTEMCARDRSGCHSHRPNPKAPPAPPSWPRRSPHGWKPTRACRGPMPSGRGREGRRPADRLVGDPGAGQGRVGDSPTSARWQRPPVGHGLV
jgi:hypothetical protein